MVEKKERILMMNARHLVVSEGARERERGRQEKIIF